MDQVNLEEVVEALPTGLSRLFQCEHWDRGEIRIYTPFLLPNRDPIALFLVPRHGQIVVTDLGLAIPWLKSNFAPHVLTPLLRGHIADVAQVLDVSIRDGQLEVACSRPAELADAIHRVGDAVARVAELRRLMNPDAVSPLDSFEQSEAESGVGAALVHSTD